MKMCVVIWWVNSSNSKKLEEIASDICDTKKIEVVDEIEASWFIWKTTVWLSAWASTPDWLIDDVENYISELTEL